MKLFQFLFVQMFLLSLALTHSGASIANDRYDEEGLNDLPEVHILQSKDFRKDSQLAKQKKAPILILFSMEGCSYCRFVEEEHLKPMLRNANYMKKVVIRKVMTDDYGSVIDFNGKSLSGMDFSTRYRAYLTPTVIFVDHNGKQLSRIMGVRNTEFYGGDLDKSLDISLQIIRQQFVSSK